jgi:hypothetical protein
VLVCAVEEDDEDPREEEERIPDQCDEPRNPLDRDQEQPGDSFVLQVVAENLRRGDWQLIVLVVDRVEGVLRFSVAVSFLRKGKVLLERKLRGVPD